MHIQKANLEIEDKLCICREIMENLSKQKYRAWLFSQNIQITDWIHIYTYIWDLTHVMNGNDTNYTSQHNYPDPESDHDIKNIFLFLISCDFDYLLPLYSMSQMNLDTCFINDINDMFEDDDNKNLKAKIIFESQFTP